MFSIPTSLHPRKSHSRDFKPPLLWPWSLSPAIELSSGSHRHTRIIFRLSDGNRGWSWGRKAGSQEFTEGSRQRLGAGVRLCSVGWAVFRGAIPYRQRGWKAREGGIGEISLLLKDFFLHLCQYQLFLGRHGQQAPAPLSGRRGPQTSGSRARTPLPRLVLLSLALQLSSPPFKF